MAAVPAQIAGLRPVLLAILLASLPPALLAALFTPLLTKRMAQVVGDGL
jgi:hypothetical protein